MAQGKYTISEFDTAKASTGGLCVMVASDTGTTVEGAGICRRRSGSQYEFILDGETYVFNEKGLPVSDNAKGYNLKLGTIERKLTTEGSAVSSDTKTVITRATDESGNLILTPTTTTGDYTVMIDSLNPRDQFAMEAMRGILGHITNPSELSDSQIAFYCDAAYKWAANMMALAASTRSTVKDASTTTDAKTAEVGTLESNTEKLLNNIIVALEKTDASITVNGSTEKVNAERVTIPELISTLNAYMKNGETTVGLKDLIDAVKNIKVTSDNNTMNIGSNGLGRNADNPIFISGGSFPSRQVLASAFASAAIHDFLTFNSSGAVGYSTLDEVKKVVNGWISSYADLEALATAVYNSIKSTIQTLIDDRCKAWLSAAKVTINGTDYSLTVNTPL